MGELDCWPSLPVNLTAGPRSPLAVAQRQPGRSKPMYTAAAPTLGCVWAAPAYRHAGTALGSRSAATSYQPCCLSRLCWHARHAVRTSALGVHAMPGMSHQQAGQATGRTSHLGCGHVLLPMRVHVLRKHARHELGIHHAPAPRAVCPCPPLPFSTSPVQLSARCLHTTLLSSAFTPRCAAICWVTLLPSDHTAQP